jgi:hypothetical protein
MASVRRRWRKLQNALLAIVVVAAVSIFAFWLWNNLPDAHPAAVRNDYIHGRITLDQARRELGDAIVDTWPVSIHEQARLRRDTELNGAKLD